MKLGEMVLCCAGCGHSRGVHQTAEPTRCAYPGCTCEGFRYQEADRPWDCAHCGQKAIPARVAACPKDTCRQAKPSHPKPSKETQAHA